MKHFIIVYNDVTLEDITTEILDLESSKKRSILILLRWLTCPPFISGNQLYFSELASLIIGKNALDTLRWNVPTYMDV